MQLDHHTVLPLEVVLYVLNTVSNRTILPFFFSCASFVIIKLQIATRAYCAYVWILRYILASVLFYLVITEIKIKKHRRKHDRRKISWNI